MDVMQRLANSIVVPVVVLDKVEDAIPTAKAMAAGGVDTMEFLPASAMKLLAGVLQTTFLLLPAALPPRRSWAL